MTLGGLWRHALEFREMRLLCAVVATCAGVLAWWRPAGSAWLVAAGCAALAWLLAEYLFHRFVLHLPQPPQPYLRKLHGRLHHKHHESPDDKPWLLFVPLFGSVQLLAMAFGAGWAAGGAVPATGATLGLSAMLCHYELTHLAAHVPYQPRTAWGRMLKRAHRWHHFKNEHYWFGVTHPFMDLLFRTWPEQATVQKSRTARTLGVETETDAG
jgi:4-hydroxysphinganine ceramide fatty acyl 2-hydroxylase